MKLQVLTALALAVSAPVALAQTCASPLPMPSNMTISGTTCGGDAGLSLGGAAIPHNYVVYEFTKQDDAGAGVEPDSISVLGGADINAIVAENDCSNPPVGGSAVGFPFSIEGLTDGQQYIVVVTTDPSIPLPPTGAICDDFQVETNTLPVELQSFVVD